MKQYGTDSLNIISQSKGYTRDCIVLKSAEGKNDVWTAKSCSQKNFSHWKLQHLVTSFRKIFAVVKTTEKST